MNWTLILLIATVVGLVGYLFYLLYQAHKPLPDEVSDALEAMDRQVDAMYAKQAALRNKGPQWVHRRTH